MLSEAQRTIDSDDETVYNYVPYTPDDDNISDSNNKAVYYVGNKRYSLSQRSFLSPDGYRSISSQSFLAPPSFHHTDRPLIGSSFDSSNLHVWRRSLRRNSHPRVYNFEDDKNNITLLTFVRAVQGLSKRIGNCVRKSGRALFVPRPKKRHFALSSEVLQQTNWICADFIVYKLVARQLMGRKVGLTAPDWWKSAHVINATACLESAHPETYVNVSKKLGMTMTSRKIIRSTLTLLLAVLFEKDVTWGKIVSMFSVAGLFAEECVCQGHAEFVKEVFDVVVAFTDCRLSTWLVTQGGWDAFPVPGCCERNRLSKFRLLVLVCFTSMVAVLVYTFLDLWGDK